MRMPLLYFVAGGFVGGIFLRSIFQFDPGFELLVFLLAAVLLAYFKVTRNAVAEAGAARLPRSPRSAAPADALFLAFVVVISASIGMLRYTWFTSYHGDSRLEERVGTKMEAEGIVVEEPVEKENGTRLTIALDVMIAQSGTTTIRKTKITALDGPYSRISYGDRVRIVGKLEKPKNFKTEGEREFNYVAYLAKDKIFYQISYPKISVVSKHNGNIIKEYLFAIKQKYIEKLDRVLPYPESRLAAGLTVAGKGVLPKSVQEDFQNSGTMQVVVLSGYNVTIIAEAAAKFLSFLPKLWSGSIAIIGILFFTVMAGGSATIVRGSLMAILVVLATLLRRRSRPGRALVLAGVFMLLLNPMLLVFDPSFQLSFLATFGLIVVSPLIKNYFPFVTEKWNLREVVSATLATQVFVTPFILYQTGQLSLVALPANLLLFLVIPITMLASFAAGMLAFLAVPIALPFSALAFLLLGYELGIVHIFSRLPFATIAHPYLPWWLVALVYACYGVVLVRLRRSETAGHYTKSVMKF